MNVSSTNPLEAADDPDKDEYYYSIKKRIYQSAKEGFSLNLQVLISRVDSAEVRNVLVNQASKSFPGKSDKEWKIFRIITERKTRNFPQVFRHSSCLRFLFVCGCKAWPHKRV